jgi:DNA-binding NtrC family response regulator
MGAGDTCDELQVIDPAIKVLLSSGYGVDQQTSEIIKRGCKGFIQKPFNMQGLSEKIGEILNQA